jgi:hypothetical protein
MSMRQFTVREANEVLIHIRPLVGQLVALQQQVANQVEDAFTNLPDAYLNVGNPAASTIAQEFVVIETLMAQIQSHGCEIKDISEGLIDFYGEIDGRIVNLCWKFGEPEISFYHELDEGFDGRRPLDSSAF